MSDRELREAMMVNYARENIVVHCESPRPVPSTNSKN